MMSLSMSMNEAAEGGGMGDILRRIPERMITCRWSVVAQHTCCEYTEGN